MSVPARPLDAWKMSLAGVSLVEASAGTGKTYTIGTLAIRLLAEAKLSIGQILVVTFTTAATAELRARLRERVREAAEVSATLVREGTRAAPATPLSEWLRTLPHLPDAAARLGDAAAMFDDAPISTLHGFCQRALTAFAFETGQSFAISLDASEGRYLLEIVQDFWARSLRSKPIAFVRRAKAKLGDFDDLVKLARLSIEYPDTPILPEGEPVSVDAELARFRAACLRFQAIWVGIVSDVPQLFSGPSFKAQAQRAASFPGYCREIDAWLARLDEDAVDRPPELDHFAASKVKERTLSGKTPLEHPILAAADELLAAHTALCDRLDQGVTALRRDLAFYARHEMARKKERRGTAGFNDLVTALAKALAGPRGPHLAATLRARYPAAMVDEFQDTDPAQFGIVRAIWPSDVAASRLFLIGDPKQAIYSFRGADVFAYLTARALARSVHTMGTNWRSDPAVLRANRAIFSSHPQPFFDARIGFSDVGPRPDAGDVYMDASGGASGMGILFLRDPEGKSKTPKEAERFATRAATAEIASLLATAPSTATSTVDGQALAPHDVTVLVRTNRQAEAMKEALGAAGVRAVLTSPRLVWMTDDAEDLEHVLAAMAEPVRRGLVARALLTPLFGQDAQAIAAAHDPEAGDAKAATAWELLAERFAVWHEVWLTRGFMPAFRRFFADSGAPARLVALPGGERKLTNLLHLAELLHRACQTEHLGMAGTVRFLKDARQSDTFARVRGGGDAGELRLESDDDAVRIMTIHRAKGLEFGVVVLPYLWESTVRARHERGRLRFHDDADDDTLKIDVGSDDEEAHLERALREEAAEGQRLLYVALTRAKHRMVVVWGRIDDAERSPLGRLLLSSGPGGDAAFAKKLAPLGEAEWLLALRKVEAASGGAIAVQEVDGHRRVRIAAAKDAKAPRLEARVPSRVHSPFFRTGSFSALVHDAGASPSGAEEHAAPPDDAGDPLERRAESQLRGRFDGESGGRDPGAAIGDIALATFPRGAGPGQLLHDVLEQIDYDADAAAIARFAPPIFARYGIDLAFVPAFADAIADALRTPIPLPDGGVVRLCDLPRSGRHHELEFLLPVFGPKRTAGERLTPARLAQPFRAHPSAEIGASYAKRLRELRFFPLEGYLRGFIDLVFTWRGRSYLVDFKSTHLGVRADDYRGAALSRAMEEAHYPLQYHLYALALHRALAQRQPGYDYDEQFGGAIYLFVRGMSEAHARGTGVFVEKPPAERILALSAILAGESP